MDRNIRVQARNARRFATALRAAGFSAVVVDGCSTRLMGGCSDPGHCPQHESFDRPDLWAGILTNASGRQAHRVWVTSGVLPRCPAGTCRSCDRLPPARSDVVVDGQVVHPDDLSVEVPSRSEAMRLGGFEEVREVDGVHLARIAGVWYSREQYYASRRSGRRAR